MTLIRAATPDDLPGAYRVCLLTGDAGRDASAMYRDPELLGQVYVGPYVIGAPELARVVEDDEGIAGYVLGVTDTRAFEAWAEDAWWPPLRTRYPLLGDGSRDAELIAQLHAPSLAPEALVRDHPAHLHIDLLDRVRGRGLGRRLIEGLLDQLRARDVSGVHLDVARANANAIAFYRHLGFDVILEEPDSLGMGRRLT